MGAGEEEFSHSEGASWGKIQEFSAAVEGRQAGWGDGACPGIAAATAPAGDAHVTLLALPGLWHLGTEVLGSPAHQWRLSQGQCGSVGRTGVWAACGQAMSVVWKGLCLPPAPLLPTRVPALAFGGCLFPIPVPAVGEQGLGTGVLVHSWSHRVWAPWTQQGLAISRWALGVLRGPVPCPEPWGCGGSTGTRFSRVKDALSCCLGNGSSSSPPCGSGTAPPPASPRCRGEGEGSSRPPVLAGPEAWLPWLPLLALA